MQTLPSGARIDRTLFVERVRLRIGAPECAGLETIIATTISVLLERLALTDAVAVARWLPTEWGRSSRCALPLREFGMGEFWTRIARRLHPIQSTAHCVAVCQILAETVDEQTRTHLRMQPLSPLFHGGAV